MSLSPENKSRTYSASPSLVSQSTDLGSGPPGVAVPMTTAFGPKSIGVPLIGTRHGSIELRRVALWLGRCLSEKACRHLERVWVIAPAGSETELMWALRTEFAGKR